MIREQADGAPEYMYRWRRQHSAYLQGARDIYFLKMTACVKGEADQ